MSDWITKLIARILDVNLRSILKMLVLFLGKLLYFAFCHLLPIAIVSVVVATIVYWFAADGWSWSQWVGYFAILLIFVDGVRYNWNEAMKSFNEIRDSLKKINKKNGQE